MRCSSRYCEPAKRCRFHSRDGITPETSPSMSMPVGRPKPSEDMNRHVSSMSVSLASSVAAVIVVPVNIAFGIAAAWAIARFRFPGRKLLMVLLEIPFSISPIIAGICYLLLYGRQGLLGPWLAAHDIKVMFAVPGIVLVTLFVTAPFVAREVLPLMQAQGSEQEEAAVTLGARGWQVFSRVTLPNIKWGLLYGVILTNARAMGEFGAVSVVSGHIRGQTNTLPLHVEILYNEYMFSAAFAVASLLAMLALVTLVIKNWIEYQAARSYRTTYGTPQQESAS